MKPRDSAGKRWFYEKRNQDLSFLKNGPETIVNCAKKHKRVIGPFTKERTAVGKRYSGIRRRGKES